MNEQLRNPESGWVTGLPVPYQLRFYSPDELPTEPPGGSETFELRPGSVLYLPRGHWHATETIEDSLSIELSLPTDAWADLVLDGLRTVLYPRQEWREAAVGAWGTERQRARARRCLAGLMADLGEALAQLRPEDLVGPAKPRPPELSARTGAIRPQPLEWSAPDPAATRTCGSFEKGFESSRRRKLRLTGRAFASPGGSSPLARRLPARRPPWPSQTSLPTTCSSCLASCSTWD